MISDSFRFSQNTNSVLSKTASNMRGFLIFLLVIAHIHGSKISLNNLRSSASDSTRNPTIATAATGSSVTGSAATGSASPTASPATASTTRIPTSPATTSRFSFCYVCGGFGQQACPDPFPSNGGVVQKQQVLRTQYCVVSEE